MTPDRSSRRHKGPRVLQNYDRRQRRVEGRNVEGFSRAEYVIGISYSSGFVANTLALVRTGGSAKLYNDAIKNLWDNFKLEYGSTEGRNLLLANVRYDTDILNLLLYTQTDLYIHADIIEFEE